MKNAEELSRDNLECLASFDLESDAIDLLESPGIYMDPSSHYDVTIVLGLLKRAESHCLGLLASMDPLFVTRFEGWAKKHIPKRAVIGPAQDEVNQFIEAKEREFHQG
jgi:hypothetical protein